MNIHFLRKTTVAIICASLGYTSTSVGAGSIPEYIQKHGGKVIKEFPSRSGMIGLVVERNGSKQFLYMTKDRKYAMSGQVFDANGISVSAEDLSARPSLLPDSLFLTPKADTASLYSQIERAAYIVDGRSKKVLYVFFDPSCQHCHDLWRRMRPYVEAGRVELRWIPLGFVTPESKSQSAYIYEGGKQKDQLERLTQIMNRKAPASSRSVTPTKDVVAKLMVHQNLLINAGGNGVPSVAYRNNESQIKFTASAPKDNAMFAAMFGL